MITKENLLTEFVKEYKAELVYAVKNEDSCFRRHLGLSLASVIHLYQKEWNVMVITRTVFEKQGLLSTEANHISAIHGVIIENSNNRVYIDFGGPNGSIIHLIASESIEKLKNYNDCKNFGQSILNEVTKHFKNAKEHISHFKNENYDKVITTYKIEEHKKPSPLYIKNQHRLLLSSNQLPMLPLPKGFSYKLLLNNKTTNLLVQDDTVSAFEKNPLKVIKIDSEKKAFTLKL